LRKKLNDINQGIKALNSELVNAAVQTLQRISRSDDKVSQVLHVLFDRAIKDTPEEFQRATNRRERGNPPGKPGDPLGDQLTWEQLLSHCKGKSKLWIISVDRDYYSEYAGKLFLNPLLYQDLGRVSQPPPEVFCLDDLDEALRDFVKVMGVRAKTLPTPEESKEIKEELSALPPTGWQNIDANWQLFGMPRNNGRQQHCSAQRPCKGGLQEKV
jgi:hypothetical protein